MLVGWDSLRLPDLPARGVRGYQGGREFDESLLEQLDLLPELVGAFGFAVAKAPGYEADDFLAAAVAVRGEAPAARRSSPPPTATSSSSRARGRRSSSRCAASPSSRASGRPRCASATASSPSRCRTSSRCAATPRTSCPGRAASGRRRPRTSCASTAPSRPRWQAGRFAAEAEDLRLYRRIATLDASAPLPPLENQTPTWAEASALVRGWGLNQLADRLEKVA